MTERPTLGGIESVMMRTRSLVALVLLAALVAACGGGDSSSATKPKPSTTTTTAPPPVAPLTGLSDPQRVALSRSALSVKIENTPDARPQSGLDAADVVYEEVVEGGITRFWAIFHSNAPSQVGPIRSVREMDPNVVSPLGGVVAFSGGTQANVDLMRAAPVTWVDESNSDGNKRQASCDADATATYCRSSKRAAPHNLFGRTAPLWARGGKPVPPVALFTYLPSQKPFTGDPVASFKLGFERGYDVTYVWDPPSAGWKRVQGLQPFLSDTLTQLAPTNVVVQFVTYTGGGEGQLIGQGDAWVFSNGQLIKGHWAKSSATQATVFSDATGHPIALTPGHTWVEFFPVAFGQGVTVTPAPGATTTPPSVATTTTRR